MLEPGEKEMIAGVMRLGDLPVGAVMTPRHEVDLIDLSDPDAEVATTILNSNHSRFPVFDGNRDNALGIVKAKDMLDAYLSGQTPDIRAADPRGADHSGERRCARRGGDPARFRRCISASSMTNTAPSRAW